MPRGDLDTSDERTALARAIALWVAQHRAVHGLSQQQLADVLGIKRPQISRLESGRVTPDIDTVIRLVRHLALEIAIDLRPTATAPKLLTTSPRTLDATAAYASDGVTVLIASAYGSVRIGT